MDLYHMPLSAPCRGTRLTAAALEVPLNLKHLDLLKGEQMAEEFLAINPQHCVPTLVDGDLTLWESRAISCYLVNQYGKDDSLYPKDVKKRAQVDKMLYFDMGTLYGRYSKYTYPVAFHGAAKDPAALASLQEALGWLDASLKGRLYACGDDVTIADHALAASVSTIKASGIDITRHANLVAWLDRCASTMPGYEDNQVGADEFGGFVKPKLRAA